MSRGLVLDYVRSLTNLYGIVFKHKVVEIYNLQNKEKINIKQLNAYVDNNFLDNFSIYIEDDLFIDDYLDDKDIEHLLNMQHSKPYYIPKKYELLKYKDEFYFEKTKQYRNLLSYIRGNIEKNHDLASEICEEIMLVILVSGGSVHSVFNELENRQIQFASEEQVRKVLNLIVEVVNNSRLKENRGYTPSELVKTSKHN